MASWIALPPQNPLYLRYLPPPLLAPYSRGRRRCFKPLNCSPLQQQPYQLQQLSVKDDDEEAVIVCELCNGIGWLLCDFCKGQKTNVKAENKRIYRRCPSCRAVSSCNLLIGTTNSHPFVCQQLSGNIDPYLELDKWVKENVISNISHLSMVGYVLCTRCKVFKCVTFPNQEDGKELSF